MTCAARVTDEIDLNLRSLGWR